MLDHGRQSVLAGAFVHADGRRGEALVAEVGAADPDRDRRYLATGEYPVVATRERLPGVGCAVAWDVEERVQEAVDQDPADTLGHITEDLEYRPRAIFARARNG